VRSGPDILDVRVTMTYTGEKARTGMVIADVGVPTGFEAVRSSLDLLVSSQVASRVELAGRKVIVYIDGLDTDMTLAFGFQMRALYPVKAEGPISRLYEYYDPKVQAYHRQDGVIVFDPTAGGRKFRRGDANTDGALNISDPVATLSYLFLGVTGQQPFCEDAADANDDGALNITDPLHVLGHLFLGGPPPAAPYPEEGVDATADELKC
jgi:hypothetical protein